ncbi:MAG: type II secretion system protein [Verrucomicrobiota bacterium]
MRLAPTNKAKRPQSAMTLIEVMVAMSLVALVMASAFVALKPAMRASENSRLNVAANELLLSELERIRGLSWEAVGEISDDSEFVTESNDQRFSTSISVAKRENRDDQLQVVLEVGWTDSSGKPQNAKIVTFITQYGISA